ncbi:MAG: dihydrolipoamide acetyltransferase family protein [Simkaniaceae bacterium]|nr:dihydrolipoamide acetyltransferase family protein [Candidatus Sacchlamyda saccharinae]
MSEDIEIALPKLGESIMSATVVQWFKKEGEPIGKDQPLLEVATDKVNSEIPSPVSGILKKIHAQPDQELNVGEPLATISTEETVATTTAPVEKNTTPITSDDNKDYYSPAVLRIARDNNIPFDELSRISGTGAGGRISKKDLENYIDAKQKPCPLAPPQEGTEHVKMKGMRKAIADNLVRSFFTAPHASLIAEIDVTNAMNHIKKEKEAFLQKHGAKLTITAVMMQALAKSLAKYPLLNATLQDDTIIVKHFINLGMAVNVEGGLLVPVIKGAEKMDRPQIAKAIADLAQKARTNTLEPDDVQDGTITVTNFGMSGIQIGTPIIRYPEVAIIGIGSIDKKAVPQEDDSIAIRQIMHLCLTFDHRIVDGMYGCDFLNSLKSELEKI